MLVLKKKENLKRARLILSNFERNNAIYFQEAYFKRAVLA
jgi:hypothetical protein